MRPVPALPNPHGVPVLTVEVAGAFLGMSRRAAYRAAAAGTLPTIRVGGRLRVPTARLYELVGLPVPSRPGAAPVVDARH